MSDAIDESAWRAARTVLDAAGYDEAGVSRVLGLVPPLTLRPGDEPMLRARLDLGQGLDVLVALLFIGDAVAERTVRNRCGTAAVDALLRIGLLERDGGALVAPVRVLPDGDLLVVADAPSLDRPDQVTGVDRATRLLRRLVPRVPVGRVLDLGCGGGALSLALARHAATVVAVDVNARAVEHARRNGALNGVRLDVRAGDWTDPVAGEQFDLVVCNPPFVVAPDARLVYRDASDGLLPALVSRIAGVLAPDAIGVLLANWPLRRDEPWAAPVRAAVAGAGCGAVALRMAVEPVGAYTARWNEPWRLRAPERYAAAVHRWLGWYAEQGIERVASGALALRRGGDGFAAFDLPDGVRGDAGAHVVRLLDALRWTPSDHDLLAARLAMADGVRVEHAAVRVDGAWAGEDPVVRAEVGLGVRMLAPAPLDALVVALDGTATLDEVAARLDVPAGVAVACARGLVASGLAVAPPPTTPSVPSASVRDQRR